MLRKLYRLKIRDRYIRALDEVKGEYHLINKPVRVKASKNKNINIFSVGKHIILCGRYAVEEGALIQVKFDLNGKKKHRFGNYNTLLPCKRFIGIGQVLRTLETRGEKYKMLIRLLDLCPA